MNTNDSLYDTLTPGPFRSTTIVAVQKDGKTAFAGDGQVTLGATVMKHKAHKILPIAGGRVLVGFAGAVADSLTLLERFEEKLDKYNANLVRAARELARDWRMDKYLRRLEAMLLTADKESLLLVAGTGEVIEPDDKVAAIGSGGPLALAAAKALMKNTSMSAEEIARESLLIASTICIYTNDQITLEVLE
jgi:ATP-dependent HslUV protease, peptidase subunit HslV